MQAENDLMEANERANMLHTQNTAFINQKRKIEGELNNVKNEVEEAVTEARNAEDAAKKALTWAALLSEDLKKEQDQSQHLERMKKNRSKICKCGWMRPSKLRSRVARRPCRNWKQNVEKSRANSKRNKDALAITQRLCVNLSASTRKLNTPTRRTKRR